jgi:hypothetical protein
MVQQTALGSGIILAWSIEPADRMPFALAKSQFNQTIWPTIVLVGLCQ